eukprot:6482305-Pyramimonas_sp.AAC.2
MRFPFAMGHLYVKLRLPPELEGAPQPPPGPLAEVDTLAGLAYTIINTVHLRQKYSTPSS